MQKFSQKEEEEDWGNFTSLLNCITPINLDWNRVRQLKGKKNIFEVNAGQYKESKSMGSKIGSTLAELSFPQKYDPTFLELKKKEE